MRGSLPEASNEQEKQLFAKCQLPNVTKCNSGVTEGHLKSNNFISAVTSENSIAVVMLTDANQVTLEVEVGTLRS